MGKMYRDWMCLFHLLPLDSFIPKWPWSYYFDRKVPGWWKIWSLGRVLGVAVLDGTSVLAEVHFGFLDAGEDLIKKSLVLRLRAIFQNCCLVRQCSGAGQAAAGLAVCKGTVRCLDGFMAELVCGLLTPLQQFVIFHLEKAHLIKFAYILIYFMCIS